MGNIFDPKRLLEHSNHQVIINKDDAYIFGGDNALEHRVSKLAKGFAIEYYRKELPESLHQLLLKFIGNANDYNMYFKTQLMSDEHLKMKAKLNEIKKHKRQYYKDDYSFDLFDCYQDVPTMCDVFFCGCCAVAEIADDSCKYNGVGYCAGCIICCCAPCLYPCLITPRVRYKNGVDGYWLKDLLRCYLCGCCEICVHLRETRASYHQQSCVIPQSFCGLLCLCCCR